MAQTEMEAGDPWSCFGDVLMTKMRHPGEERAKEALGEGALAAGIQNPRRLRRQMDGFNRDWPRAGAKPPQGRRFLCAAGVVPGHRGSPDGRRLD